MRGKRGSVFVIILAVFVIAVIGAGAYIYFGSSDSSDNSEDGSSNLEISDNSDLEIDCGFVADEVIHSSDIPTGDAMNSLVCNSESVMGCKKSKISYTSGNFYVVEDLGDKCKLKYSSPDSGSIECDFKKSLLEETYQKAKDNNAEWSTGFGITFIMSMNLFAGESEIKNIKNETVTCIIS